jgi:hypothetical protein
MKLQTLIAPRLDGTVIVHGTDGKDYVFRSDDSGVLVCEVEDESTLKSLLANEAFEPANPEEFESALAMIQKPAHLQEQVPVDFDPDGDEDVQHVYIPDEPKAVKVDTQKPRARK